jgi:hypothetical protein
VASHERIRGSWFRCGVALARLRTLPVDPSLPESSPRRRAPCADPLIQTAGGNQWDMSTQSSVPLGGVNVRSCGVAHRKVRLPQPGRDRIILDDIDTKPVKSPTRPGIEAKGDLFMRADRDGRGRPRRRRKRHPARRRLCCTARVTRALPDMCVTVTGCILSASAPDAKRSQ